MIFRFDAAFRCLRGIVPSWFRRKCDSHKLLSDSSLSHCVLQCIVLSHSQLFVWTFLSDLALFPTVRIAILLSNTCVMYSTSNLKRRSRVLHRSSSGIRDVSRPSGFFGHGGGHGLSMDHDTNASLHPFLASCKAYGGGATQTSVDHPMMTGIDIQNAATCRI